MIESISIKGIIGRTLRPSSLPNPSWSFSSSYYSRHPLKKTFSRIFQECSATASLGPAQQSHALMVITGFNPTTFVANCLIHLYVRCSRLDLARKVFDQMPLRDVTSWNALISGSALHGSMEDAMALFETMPDRDAISWNSIMSGFLREGSASGAVHVFARLRREDGPCDHATMALALKSCASLEDATLGIQVHSLSVRMGLHRDVVAGSAMVDMYAKCRCLESSVRFFDEMPARNNVSWGAIVAGCVQNEHFCEGFKLFIEMVRAGIEVSQSIYASMFRSCAGLSSLELGRQMHCHALKNDFGLDAIVGTAILDMYAKCGRLENARRAFQLLPVHNLESWNAMIVGQVRNGQCYEAIELFRRMHGSGVGVNEVSISGAFSACAGSERYLEGLQVHAIAIRRNLDCRVIVQNAALDMYAKCKYLTEGCEIFDCMEVRDVVSWNAMIAALERNGKYEETLIHFDKMLSYGMEPDEFTFGSALKACAALSSLDHGLRIHARSIKFGMGVNLFVGCSLVDMYCKCEAMGEAKKIHERLGDQSTVSWNAMVSGFSLLKQSEESQIFFSRMLEKGLKPDNFTYSTILDTCANLATIELGKQIHAQIIKQQLQGDIYISSTLVDMYSKCGNMDDSLLMFERMLERDVVSWNAMISGYAQHGHAVGALKFFDRMILGKVKPNHATFIAVLRACAHMGLFDKGIDYFHSMSQEHGLEPQLEHYSCMVDILGRSGRVTEAFKLIKEMPCEADATLWRNLLSCCQFHKNLKVAEIAANSILQLEPDDSSAYILLCNIYAESGKWEEVSKIRRILWKNKLKKEPGCSWIQVKNEVHSFLVGDKAHPRCTEIYETLDLLIGEIKKDRYPYDTD